MGWNSSRIYNIKALVQCLYRETSGLVQSPIEILSPQMNIFPSLLDWLPGPQHQISKFRGTSRSSSLIKSSGQQTQQPGEPAISWAASSIRWIRCCPKLYPCCLQRGAWHAAAPVSSVYRNRTAQSYFQEEETLVMTTHNLFFLQHPDHDHHRTPRALHSTQIPRGDRFSNRRAQDEETRVWRWLGSERLTRSANLSQGEG